MNLVLWNAQRRTIFCFICYALLLSCYEEITQLVVLLLRLTMLLCGSKLVFEKDKVMEIVHFLHILCSWHTTTRQCLLQHLLLYPIVRIWLGARQNLKVLYRFIHLLLLLDPLEGVANKLDIIFLRKTCRSNACLLPSLRTAASSSQNTVFKADTLFVVSLWLSTHRRHL